MKVKEHYDNHLGHYYSWMTGDFQQKQQEQQSFFEMNNFQDGKTKVAIDLGCGHGLQSVSLAKLGYTVHAVDFNKKLLRELAERRDELPIIIHENEIIKFLHDFSEKADLIVCMGDTLPHLDSLLSVELLVHEISNKLIDGGKTIFSFRDLTTELKDDQRFILVKSDHDRIHTCFLEYLSDHVRVHDVLHQRDGAGWKQSVSWYPKLRINESTVQSILEKAKFTSIDSQVVNRMIYVIAQK